MMMIVVNGVLNMYHEKEMMKKSFDKVKMANCDICHDRPNPSFCNNNRKNKNKNMRTPPMTKKNQNKYRGNDGVRTIETAMMMMRERGRERE